MQCSTPAGSDSNLPFSVAISQLTGTGASSYSFWSVPEEGTRINPVNGPSSTLMMTVLGVNFGDVDLTATVQVAATVCQTTSWSSWTTAAVPALS